MTFSELPGFAQTVLQIVLVLGYVIIAYLAFDFVLAINRLINAKAKLWEEQAYMIPFKKTDE